VNPFVAPWMPGSAGAAEPLPGRKPGDETVSAVGLQPGRVEYKVSLMVRYALAAK
jgi:hypothetical protein